MNNQLPPALIGTVIGGGTHHIASWLSKIYFRTPAKETSCRPYSGHKEILRRLDGLESLLDTSYSRDVVAPVESLATAQCYNGFFQWITLALCALVVIGSCVWRWWHRCESSKPEAGETLESYVDRAEKTALSTLSDRPIAVPTLPLEDRRVYSDPVATEVPVYVPRRRRLA